MTYSSIAAAIIVNLLSYYQRHSMFKNKKVKSNKENKQTARHVADRKM